MALLLESPSEAAATVITTTGIIPIALGCQYPLFRKRKELAVVYNHGGHCAISRGIAESPKQLYIYMCVFGMLQCQGYGGEASPCGAPASGYPPCLCDIDPENQHNTRFEYETRILCSCGQAVSNNTTVLKLEDSKEEEETRNNTGAGHTCAHKARYRVRLPWPQAMTEHYDIMDVYRIPGTNAMNPLNVQGLCRRLTTE